MILQRHQTLNRYDINPRPLPVLPQGKEYRRFELKTCENCGNSFMREPVQLQEFLLRDKSRVYRDKGQRYCRDCQHRALSVDPKQLLFLEALPETHRSSHIPIKRHHATTREATQRWRLSVIAATAVEGKSLEQLVELIPGCLTPDQAYGRMVGVGLILSVVGSAPRRVSLGKAPNLYRVDGRTNGVQ